MPSLSAEHEPQRERDPRTAVVLRDDPEHERRQQQPPDGDGVGPGGQGALARRASGSSSCARTRSMHRAGRDEIGTPSASTISTVGEGPRRNRHRRPTWTTPSISGASRWLRPTPARVDQHLDGRADERRPAAAAVMASCSSVQLGRAARASTTPDTWPSRSAAYVPSSRL